MSKLFKYSKVKDVVNFDGMLPGQKSRTTPTDIHYAGLIKNVDLDGNAIEYVENGELVVLDRGTDGSTGKLTYSGVFVNKSTADEFTNTLTYGVVLADIKGQTERTPGPNFIYKHLPNTTVTVMTKGYVYVPIQDNGDIVAGGSVYTDKKGGIFTTVLTEEAETEGEEDVVLTVEIPNAKFTGLWGYPLSSKQNGTQGTNLTGRTAEIVLDVDLF